MQAEKYQKGCKHGKKGKNLSTNSLLCRKKVERNMLPYFVEESENIVLGKWRFPTLLKNSKTESEVSERSGCILRDQGTRLWKPGNLSNQK